MAPPTAAVAVKGLLHASTWLPLNTTSKMLTESSSYPQSFSLQNQECGTPGAYQYAVYLTLSHRFATFGCYQRGLWVASPDVVLVSSRCSDYSSRNSAGDEWNQLVAATYPDGCRNGY